MIKMNKKIIIIKLLCSGISGKKEEGYTQGEKHMGFYKVVIVFYFLT